MSPTEQILRNGCNNHLPYLSTASTETYQPPLKSGPRSKYPEEASSDVTMPSSQFRRFKRGITITFGCAPHSTGMLLVAMTDRGVCAIVFGDTPRELQGVLDLQFVGAKIKKGNQKFQKWVTLVASYIDDPTTPFPLPLDIQATAFQARVWESLRAIPYGTTVSYTEIAERIGCPKGVRAVAKACASNTVAVVIPCHRVVGKDGKLTGYRWGLARKRALLECEVASYHKSQAASESVVVKNSSVSFSPRLQA